MNEKYGDDDEYYGQEDPDEETNQKGNKKKPGNASESDDSDDDNESKRSDASDDEEGEISEDEDDDMDDEDVKQKRLFTKDKSSNEAQQNYPVSDEDEDEDEDDDYDENYLQKFDETLKQNIISEYHPEMQQLNYSEVELLTTIHRDEEGQIYDPLHRTLPFLTKFEKARVLGERAKQLNSGAKPLIDIEPSIIDGYLIALKEYEQKRIPFIIKRPLPNGGIEYWKFEDLEMID
jgi:DNA-directed RNA polymerase I, II, and III subunit RPABC2